MTSTRELLQRAAALARLEAEMQAFVMSFRMIRVYCRDCGRLFQHGVGFRVQARYCSNACRQRAYRKRHGQKHDRPGRPRHANKT